jgi:hypothetical protein
MFRLYAVRSGNINVTLLLLLIQLIACTNAELDSDLNIVFDICERRKKRGNWLDIGILDGYTGNHKNKGVCMV